MQPSADRGRVYLLRFCEGGRSDGRCDQDRRLSDFFRVGYVAAFYRPGIFCPFGCRVCHGCLYVVRGIPPLQLFPCFTFHGVHDAADVVSCDIQSGFRLRLFRGCSRYYELGDVF